MRLILWLCLLLPLTLNAAEPLKVVTSFSILADMTRQIGGQHIELSNIVGAQADAHTFEPGAKDARHIQQAALVIGNGLHFEPWLDRLINSTQTQALVIRVSDGVIPRSMDQNGQTIADPHAWNNLANAKIYAANIKRALLQADPDNAAAYERNYQTYIARIDALLVVARQTFVRLPPGSRRVVTSHDAFAYLGQAYGIRFSAPQGLSTEREPSAAEVATLIQQIRAENIKALFVENIKDGRLLKQIAEQSGVRIGGTLYSDALAAEGPASTYLGMYRHNIETLAKALGN